MKQKLTIVGAGNMGGAIALGLMQESSNFECDITLIDRRGHNIEKLKKINPRLNIVNGDYSSISTADIIILAIKPWLIEDFIKEHYSALRSDNQSLVSVAATISVKDLERYLGLPKKIYRVVPNTAMACQESMTFISSNVKEMEEDDSVVRIFKELGVVKCIDESLIPAATSIASCGIAYGFKYIKASMQGAVELGFKPDEAKEIVLQTLQGAITILEEEGKYPDTEIDKVTTAGGITIKGVNELDHQGFTSAIIKTLKTSCVSS